MMAKKTAVAKQKALKEKIKRLQRLYDLPNATMGLRLHVSERSWNRRLQSIGDMKVKDLLRLEEVLHTTLVDTEEKDICI